MVEDTSKQKKKTSINGNTESVMPCSNEQSKEENKQKFPSENDFNITGPNYGFNGLVNIFHKKEIDMTDWLIEKTDKARGGIEFMLPNAEGKIFLNWGDMYSVDVTFVNTKGKYKEVVTLPTLEVLIDELEEQRKRTVGLIKDMLKDAFNGEAPEGKPF